MKVFRFRNITSVHSNGNDDSLNFTENHAAPATPNDGACHHTKQGKCGNCKTFLSHMNCGPFLGIIYTFLCSLFMIFASVILKKMTYVSPGQLSFVSSTALLAGCIPTAVFSGQNLLGPKKYRLLLIGRGFFGATALYLHILAYNLLPLAEATIILSTTPVVTMILARIYLKERCGILQTSVLIITILGVLLSVRIPELIKDREFNFTIDYIKGLASAIGCVFFLSITFLWIRKMKDVHYSVVIMYSGLVGVVENGGLTAAFSFYKLPRCGWDPILMMCLGIFRLMGLSFMVLAIQFEAVGNATVVRSCLDIVIAFIFQVLFFGDVPDAYNSCGALIVVISLTAIGASKWLLQLPEHAKARQKMKFFLK